MSICSFNITIAKNISSGLLLIAWDVPLCRSSIMSVRWRETDDVVDGKMGRKNQLCVMFVWCSWKCNVSTNRRSWVRISSRIKGFVFHLSHEAFYECWDSNPGTTVCRTYTYNCITQIHYTFLILACFSHLSQINYPMWIWSCVNEKELESAVPPNRTC